MQHCCVYPDFILIFASQLGLNNGFKEDKLGLCGRIYEHTVCDSLCGISDFDIFGICEYRALDA